jgi:hypothetical protein
VLKSELATSHKSLKLARNTQKIPHFVGRSSGACPDLIAKLHRPLQLAPVIAVSRKFAALLWQWN